MGGLLKYVGTNSQGQKFYEGAVEFSFKIATPSGTTTMTDIMFNFTGLLGNIISYGYSGEYAIDLRGTGNNMVAIMFPLNELSTIPVTITIRMIGTFCTPVT